MSCCLPNDNSLDFLELKKLVSQKSMFINESTLIELNRGGKILQTKIGNIQFGMPPETIKDSINAGIDIPKYWIIPTNRFDFTFCINVAEFEFPAYFSFFVLKQRINLICTQEAEQAIRTVFQETLLGPKSFETIEEDYDPHYDKEKRIQFEKELASFARNPFNPSEPLSLETIINFIIFDENNEVKLEDDIVVKKEEKQFLVLEDGQILGTFKDKVKIKLENQLLADFNDAQKFGLFMDLQVSMIKEKVIEQKQSYDPLNFTPPKFGITILGNSHGFDAKGSTSGYIIWINGRGVMVDPPPYSTHQMQKMGIPSLLIDSVILSHCHADHDAGLLQKVLKSQRVEVITTKTIMNSYIRKYCAIGKMKESELRRLFIYRPAVIGKPQRVNGALFNFFYSLHAIPCIGFTVHFCGKSIYFSGDTFYDPLEMKKRFLDTGIMSQKRYDQLVNNKWSHDIILHEAGVPPIHTPMKLLAELPPEIKKKMYLVHTCQKDIPVDSGLQIAKIGLENTIVTDVINQGALDYIWKLDILSEVSIFSNCAVRQIRDLLDSGREKQLQSGEFVFKEGDLANDIYIILNGVVKIFSNQNDTQQIERYYHIGDYFGESALQKQQSQRSLNAQAVTDVLLLGVNRRDFIFVFGDEGQVIEKMTNLYNIYLDNVIHTINKNSLLNTLNSSQQIQFEMLLKQKDYKAGTVIWKSGQPTDFAILIQKGTAQFFDCEEKDLMDIDLESGAFVGEINSIINSDGINTTNLKAVTDVKAFQIKKYKLCAFLSSNPGLMIKLIHKKCVL